MNRIIGDLTYLDVSPEEIKRFLSEAEKARSDAIGAMFAGIFKRIGKGIAWTFDRITHPLTEAKHRRHAT